MKYEIIVKLDDNQFETEIEGNSWDEVCDYIFGRLEIINKNENLIEEKIIKPIEKLAKEMLKMTK